jgi:hypothetical protein
MASFKQFIRNAKSFFVNLFSKRQSSVFTETDKPPMVGITPVTTTVPVPVAPVPSEIVVIPPTPPQPVSSPQAGANPRAVQEALDRMFQSQSRERTPEEQAAYDAAVRAEEEKTFYGEIEARVLTDAECRYVFVMNHEARLKGLPDLWRGSALIDGTQREINQAIEVGDRLTNGFIGNLLEGVRPRLIAAVQERLGGNSQN